MNFQVWRFQIFINKIITIFILFIKYIKIENNKL